MTKTLYKDWEGTSIEYTRGYAKISGRDHWFTKARWRF